MGYRQPLCTRLRTSPPDAFDAAQTYRSSTGWPTGAASRYRHPLTSRTHRSRCVPVHQPSSTRCVHPLAGNTHGVGFPRSRRATGLSTRTPTTSAIPINSQMRQSCRCAYRRPLGALGVLDATHGRAHSGPTQRGGSLNAKPPTSCAGRSEACARAPARARSASTTPCS